MANFYVTDGTYLISHGFCADGMEQAQARPGQTVVIGAPPNFARDATPYPGARWHVEKEAWEDTRTIEVAREQAWTRIKLARAAAEAADFTWDGSAFQSDKARISGAVQMALLAQIASAPFSIDWTLSDNAVRTLSAQDMIAVGVALGQHVAGVFEIGRQLRVQIDAAATNADLAAIGWPQ
jgi:hypothetical protein